MSEHSHSKEKPLTSGSLPLLSWSPLKIGLRYLFSKKLSYLAVAGVMLSVATLVVVMSVMSGFGNHLRSIIRGYHSDLTVELREGSPYGMKEWQDLKKQVTSTPHVKAAAPYIQGFGLIKFVGSEQMDHIIFRGVSPEMEGSVSSIREYLKNDTRLEDLSRQFRDPNQATIGSCFIGNAMADLLGGNLERYDVRVVLVTATPDLRRRLRKFKVNGVFKTGRYDWDRSVVIIPLQAAMKFVDSDGGVTALSVNLDDYSNAPQVRNRLEEKLGQKYMVTTWEEKQKNFLQAVAMERFIMAVILSFILVLAGFCIFAILTTTVYEKRRDIGILKAVGFTKGMIASVFLFNGLAIGLFGSAIGIVGGKLFTGNINAIESFIERATGFTPFPQKIYYFDRIPTADSWWIPVAVAAGAILCSLIFSLLPALKAAKLDPIETLRFE